MEVSPTTDEKKVEYKLCLKPIIGSKFHLLWFIATLSQNLYQFALKDMVKAGVSNSNDS